MPPKPRFHQEDVLVNRLCNSEREIVSFLGAPLTMSEDKTSPGVPGVGSIVDLIKQELGGNPHAIVEIDKLLDANNYGGAYRSAFELLQAYRGQDAANRIIRQAVLKARAVGPDSNDMLTRAGGISQFEDACSSLQEDIANWHLRASLAALGRLLARYRPKFGSVVLTTNFDPLIEVAISRAGGHCFRSVLHADGSLGTTQGDGTHVVYLHGHWFGSDTLHTQSQLRQDRPKLRRSLEKLLAHRTLVVLGCGGWDDVFMASLADLVADQQAAPDVLWTFYASDEDKLASNPVCQTLQPGIERGRVVLFSGINLHSLIDRVHGRMQQESTGGHDPDDVAFLLERIYDLAPKLRADIASKLSSDLVAEVSELSSRRDALQQELDEERQSSGSRTKELEQDLETLAGQLKDAKRTVAGAQLALARAFMHDVSWLTMIRTQLMPKQPGRVPFHNAAEVALRGFHCGSLANTSPVLHTVTWSKLAYHENKLHRGYEAGGDLQRSWLFPGGQLGEPSRRTREAAQRPGRLLVPHAKHLFRRLPRGVDRTRRIRVATSVSRHGVLYPKPKREAIRLGPLFLRPR